MSAGQRDPPPACPGNQAGIDRGKGERGRGGVFVLFDQLEPDDQAFIDRLNLRPLESFPQVRLFQVPAAGPQ